MSDPAIQKPAAVTLRRRAKLPDRKNLPQDVNSLAVATWPQTKSKSASEANAVSPVLSAPQTISTTFDAATGDPTTGPFPPDAMGAAGPSQFILFINGRLKTFNKATGAADGVINANPDAFFSTVMTPAVAANSTSTPQIRYDRLTSRWILTIIDTPGTSAATLGDTAESHSHRSFRCGQRRRYNGRYSLDFLFRAAKYGRWRRHRRISR